VIKKILKRWLSFSKAKKTIQRSELCDQHSQTIAGLDLKIAETDSRVRKLEKAVAKDAFDTLLKREALKDG
jgi:hypothetical protein